MAVGGIVTFKIAISNAGDAQTTGTFVTLQLPAGMSLVQSGSSKGWTSIDAQKYRIDLATLDPRKSKSLTFKALTSLRGTNLGAIAIAGDDGTHGKDSKLSDNQAKATFKVT